MATLNEIAYNIKNIISGGVASDDSDVSIRQLKFMIHYHRANLLVKYTDNGRKTSNICYQVHSASPSSSGIDLDVVGFNDNKAIRSIAYKESTSIDSDYTPLPIVQNHDRAFLNSSRFISSAASKVATVSDRKLYVWEGDSLVSSGSLEVNAILANPTTASTYVDDDTTTYPIPEEIIPLLIQSILQVELSVMAGVPTKGPNNQVNEKQTKGKQPTPKKV
jgi:hypothetical protein